MKKFELAQYSGLVRKSDLGRDMTLRNASAHRRLEGELKHLDGQLRQSLISMQADIVDLKLSQNSGGRARGVRRSKSPIPQQVMKRPLARTGSGPPRTTTNSNNVNHQKHGNNKQLPIINVQSEAVDSSFLPQIRKNQSNTSMVIRRKEDPPRSRSFLDSKVSPPARPVSAELHSQGLTSSSHSNKNKLGASLSVSTNLYRPHSTPDLSSFSRSGGMTPRGRRKLPPLKQKGDKKASHSDSSSVELSDRVKDFVKRPNAGSGERQTDPTTESKSDVAADQTELLDMSGKEQEATALQLEEKKRKERKRSPERKEVDKTIEEKDKVFNLSEDDLFFNSNLLKAHSDTPLSTSLPDLASLGFMDYNEVIDRRLRDLQEWQHNPPTEEEMRKVKYLRLRNEPQTPHVLSVFDKDQ